MPGYELDNVGLEAIMRSPEVDRAVHSLADAIFADSQRTVPVDTGFLRNSGFVDGENSRYRVGYEADYAKYVEHGTGHMNPQPFLTPAALRARTVTG